MITPFLPDVPTATGASDIGAIEPPIESNQYGLIAKPIEEYKLDQKQISFVDLNLLSGSSDLLRNAVGGYFFNFTSDDGEYMVPPPFYKFLPVDNPNEFVHSVTSFTGVEVQNEIGSREARGTVSSNLGVRQETVLPYMKFITHIEGDPLNPMLSDVVKGSKYWDCLFTGKPFGDSTVTQIYSDGTYDDHYITTMMPYAKIQEQLLVAGSKIENYIQLSCEYNHILRSYQAFTDLQETERTIPNFYAFGLTAYQRDSRVLDANITNFYSLNNSITVSDLYDIYNNRFEDDVEDGVIRSVGVSPMKKYLDFSLPVSASSIPQESLNYIDSRFSNVLFNDFATRTLGSTATEKLASTMPFYNKITFATKQSDYYAAVIAKNQFSTGFLKSLKEVFLGQSPDELVPETVEFLQNQKFAVPGDGANFDDIYTTSDNTVLRSVDLVELMLYSHNKIKEENEDFFVVDYKNLETDTAYDTKGVYRAFNARNALRCINDISKTFSTNTNAFSVKNINLLLNSQNDTVHSFEVDKFNNLTPDVKDHEVLAYRVEKIGGLATGDSNTQNTIQNFWVFNSLGLEDLNLFDTQVKYDTAYTYKVYAYYAVKGFKYKFANLQISRIIGSVREDATDPESPITGYCVEFYNPETGDITTDMLESSIYGDTPDAVMSSFVTEAQRIAQSAASTSSTGVLPPYLANFITTVQPSLKLIEVPITQKAFRVLDNPPNDLNVVPNYALDNSNRILFDIFYETFRSQPYPRAITEADKTVKSQYLNAKDYISSTNVEKPTVSPANTIQIFRLTEKPKSFQDFEGNELSNVSLEIDGSEHSYTTGLFSDIVKSNVKYYYLFRAVNELGIAGNTDTVIEAELVNDGGYKYAQFEVLFEEDLSVDIYKDKNEKFKNIFQLVPNLSQTIFDDSEVDYTQSAKSQYNKLVIGNSSNEELIWSETFKIRLTSKKTGKKIDLNITYNDPSVKLEE